MDGSEGRGGPRRAVFWWLLAFGLLTVLAVGGGGYLLGRSSGEDLNQARSEGRALGERAGSARGAESGYRTGLRLGHREGYRQAYRRALRAATRKGEPQNVPAPVHRSCGDIAEEGAGTYNVNSTNVICDIALQVARQWEMECAQQPSGDCTVKAGFACDYRQVAHELGNITCSEGKRSSKPSRAMQVTTRADAGLRAAIRLPPVPWERKRRSLRPASLRAGSPPA